MKVSIKDLKLGVFDLEVEPSDTIGSLRQMVIDQKDLSNVNVTLLYSGQVLKDTALISDLNLTASSFIICLKKPKVDASKSKASKLAASRPEPATPASQMTIPPAPTAPIASTATSGFISRAASAVSPSAQADPNFESNLQSLIQLGFERPEATWALGETNGNIENAADLLMAARDMPDEGYDAAEVGLDESSGRPNIVLNQNDVDAFLTRLAQRAPEQFDQVVAALQSNPDQLVEILETMDVEQRRSFLQLLQSDPLGSTQIGQDGGDDDAMEEVEHDAVGTLPAVREPSVKDVQTLTAVLDVPEEVARDLLLANPSVENAVEEFFRRSEM